jgi:arylsulfatase A-like enzyme
VTPRRARRLALWIAALACAAPAASAADAPRPNVVFVLADDLGWGDLSSYGATDLATPNIDRLAREGIRFTDFYAAANTCSPSRAALLTGRYPPRTGVNAVLFHDTVEGLPQSEVTLAELLRDAGYATALVGKWHLGSTDEFMPWSHGFDEFFGVPYSNDEANFYVYDGRRRLPEHVDQTKLIRRYTDRALDFLDRAARAGRPFFLYLAHDAPHVPLDPSPSFAGRTKRGTYGDVVEELDASVGEVLDRIAALGIADRTLVVFTSDNGPWLAMRDWGGSAGGLRGGKTGTFEGGHRVPALARWPGAIPAASETHGVATMMDWFPTIAELAGAPLPGDRVVDGRSLVAVLRGTGEREAMPFFYLSLRTPFFGDQGHAVGAVRDGRWKLKLPQRGYPQFLEPFVRLEFGRHGLLLFDLDADPGERHDVAAQHPDVVAQLEREIDRFEASGPFPEPVRVGAAPADTRGWTRLARGVAILAAFALIPVVALLFVFVRAIRWLRRP